MRTTDAVQLAFSAIRSQRQRSLLTALGIAIGIAAVVLLTALGTGLQQFVLQRFTQFGTNLLAVTPGRKTTLGMSGAMINSVRPLSIEDAEAIATLPHVQAVCPSVFGNVAVEAGGLSRRCMANAVGSSMPVVWRFDVAQGRFLPPDDPRNARAFCVLGDKLWRELYGEKNPLGEIVRIGGDRYRVIGVMSPKGQFLGFDLDDAVYVPIGRGLEMFDREGLMEIDTVFSSEAVTDEVVAAVRRTLIARHGVDDCTITAQQQMLDVLGSILGVLTFAVAALGGISLVVGGVGILTIMNIALRERIGEIGLLRAIGATQRQLRWLFLGEAAVLATVGGTAGLVLGGGIAWLLHALVPALPIAISAWQLLLAEAVSLGIGLLAGVLPALHAARLDPIEALRAE